MGEKLDRELNQKSREGNVNTRNKYSKLRKIEARLAQARSSIKEASKVRNLTSTHQDPDYVPRGPVYTNANAFHRYKHTFSIRYPVNRIVKPLEEMLDDTQDII